MQVQRPLVSREAILAAKRYDAHHPERAPGWTAASDKQAERIITGYLLWLADAIRENAS